MTEALAVHDVIVAAISAAVGVGVSVVAYVLVKRVAEAL